MRSIEANVEPKGRGFPRCENYPWITAICEMLVISVVGGICGIPLPVVPTFILYNMDQSGGKRFYTHQVSRIVVHWYIGRDTMFYVTLRSKKTFVLKNEVSSFSMSLLFSVSLKVNF